MAEVEEARIASRRREPVELGEDRALRLDASPARSPARGRRRRAHRRATPPARTRAAAAAGSSTSPCGLQIVERLADQARRGGDASALGRPAAPSQPARANTMAQARPIRPAPTIAACRHDCLLRLLTNCHSAAARRPSPEPMKHRQPPKEAQLVVASFCIAGGHGSPARCFAATGMTFGAETDASHPQHLPPQREVVAQVLRGAGHGSRGRAPAPRCGRRAPARDRDVVDDDDRDLVAQPVERLEQLLRRPPATRPSNGSSSSSTRTSPDERAGDRHHLLLAAREIVGRRVAAARGGAGSIRRCARQSQCTPVPVWRLQAAEREVLGDRHAGEQAPALRHVADAEARDLGRGQPRDLLRRRA